MTEAAAGAGRGSIGTGDAGAMLGGKGVVRRDWMVEAKLRTVNGAGPSVAGDSGPFSSRGSAPWRRCSGCSRAGWIEACSVGGRDVGASVGSVRTGAGEKATDGVGDQSERARPDMGDAVGLIGTGAGEGGSDATSPAGAEGGTTGGATRGALGKVGVAMERGAPCAFCGDTGGATGLGRGSGMVGAGTGSTGAGLCNSIFGPVASAVPNPTAGAAAGTGWRDNGAGDAKRSSADGPATGAEARSVASIGRDGGARTGGTGGAGT